MPSATPLAFQHRVALQPLRLRLGPQTQGHEAGRTLPLQLWGCSALSPMWPQGQLDIGSTALGLLSLVIRLRTKCCSILESSEKAVDAVTPARPRAQRTGLRTPRAAGSLPATLLPVGVSLLSHWAGGGHRWMERSQGHGSQARCVAASPDTQGFPRVRFAALPPASCS